MHWPAVKLATKVEMRILFKKERSRRKVKKIMARIKYDAESHTSCLLMNNSNLSVRPGLDLCHFASGLMISGWLMIKVGFVHVSSRK